MSKLNRFWHDWLGNVEGERFCGNRVPPEGSEIGWLLLHMLLQHQIRTSNRTSNRCVRLPQGYNRATFATGRDERGPVAPRREQEAERPGFVMNGRAGNNGCLWEVGIVEVLEGVTEG